jgi:hypothetical protein
VTLAARLSYTGQRSVIDLTFHAGFQISTLFDRPPPVTSLLIMVAGRHLLSRLVDQ